MTKEQFIQKIDQLVGRADAIKYDDYYGAKSVIRDFENFVEQYGNYLPQHILEHIEITKSHFDDMKNKKRQNEKEKAWERGREDLRRDIETMRSVNTFPNEINS